MDIVMLKDHPVLNVHDSGKMEILDFNHLPFALRTRELNIGIYRDWVAQRALQLDRAHAKELLNRYRLPQYDKYRIAKACRAFSLNDSFWIKGDGDAATWADRNLFQNELSVSIIETSLSGRLHRTSFPVRPSRLIDEISPELTTWGVNAKAWIKENGILYMHKIGINEVGASEILDCLGLAHITYQLSTPEQVERYISEPVREWLTGVGEAIVNSRLFTSADVGFVSFDEFGQFCDYYHMNPFEQVMEFAPQRYHEMQVIDYILNNSDRHGQNWGFYMDNKSGKLKEMALPFDHDKAFNTNRDIMSLTSREPVLMQEAAAASLRELELDLTPLLTAAKPATMTAAKWDGVLARVRTLL